ncbi:hypothetical protein HHI36_004701 [Cryptolaemus montrouzieri]|uniref:Uncharacterized protein n=1 Tax=Cryptolaemus montrouzieri TaxID=559131 RepID=A0ABD2NSB4_9CUCU
MSFGFEPTIFQPTRGTNCFDNILINFKNFRGYNSCVVDSGLSDHEAVDIVVDSSRIFQYKTKLVSRPISLSGKQNFFDVISVVDWGFVNLPNLDVASKFRVFLDVFARAVDVSFPEK